MKNFVLLLVVVYGLVLSPVWGLSLDEKAPNFALQEFFEDKLISLEDYQGKVIYLDFWASWCGPCRQSFPALSTLHQRYSSQGFEVIAVNLDSDISQALAFVSKFPVDYPLLRGFDTDAAELYGVKVMPTAFIIDAEGNVRLVHHGFKPEHVDFLDAVIDKLLAERL